MPTAFPAVLPAGKRWFTPREAAAVLGLSPSMVEKLLDADQLLAHAHGAGPRGERFVRRISRESLEAYLARTATYEPAQRLALAQDVLRSFPAPDLLALADFARRQASLASR